ncbi:glutaminyl-peptide cyclotransferase [Halioxenophilus aromaticivorans]|uniref:glutaminyl-peptide cyclotransferase n=1 Tax=Halioxenophilus aromaticivorans TaxID=1306992 RepID=UPI0031F12017
MNAKKRILTLTTLFTWGLLALPLQSLAGNAIANLEYQIIDQQPHPKGLFTQGLLVDGPWIYESSGGYGRSSLVRYKSSDSSMLVEMPLPKNIFAEGLTLLNDRFYLLTWRAGKMLVFDRNWNPLARHDYKGEGWGLTHDGEHLIMSNGTDEITFFTTRPFKAVKAIKLHGGERRWSAINELEYANGILWANRWFSDDVLAIDPNTGEVLARLDFSDIAKQFRVGRGAREKVLNGLAWSEPDQAMWLTGKYWDRRFLVKFPATLEEITLPTAER